MSKRRGTRRLSSLQSARRSDLRGVRVRLKKKVKATIVSTKVGSGIKRRQLGRNAETKVQTRGHTKKLVMKNKEILLKRSSGRKEKFDATRLAQTMGRSGIPYLMARDIAKKVTRRIKSEATSKLRKRKSQPSKSRSVKSPTSNTKPVVVVEASQVRSIISDELRGRSRPDVASSYSGYSPAYADVQRNANATGIVYSEEKKKKARIQKRDPFYS